MVGGDAKESLSAAIPRMKQAARPSAAPIIRLAPAR